jgi:hypothetical protein
MILVRIQAAEQQVSPGSAASSTASTTVPAAMVNSA